MKKVLLVNFLAVLLVACSTLGLPTPKTFNQKVAVALTSVTSVRETTFVLLQSRKITPADAQNIQDQADNARAAITVAQGVYATDPSAGENRLAAVQVLLNGLISYLQSRQ